MRNELKHRKRQHRTEYDGSLRTNSITYCLQLGFFAGLIWGLLRWILYLIHFTKVIPGFLADPFFQQSFLKAGWGLMVGGSFYIVFSILATFLYKLVLGWIPGPWPGLCYGLFWWVVLFVFVGPAIGLFKPIYAIGYDTIFTECALYIVWGLFIGYTIAFEYTDRSEEHTSELQSQR